MKNRRRQHLDDLFKTAWGMAPADRKIFLDKECGNDVALRQEVEALLAESSDLAGQFTMAPIPTDLAREFADIIGNEGRDPLSPGRLLDLAIGPAPEQIGTYRIIRLIAVGGMGAVYEAEQEAPLRRVALKLPRMPLLTAEAARRFSHEAQILGRLQHPGIAQVYEAGTIERDDRPPHPFFAMELVSGAPITRSARERNLSARERLQLVAQVCDAVQHAHQRGVIHRDLKPDNIFINTEGQVKVLDFGIARLIDPDRAVSQHTEAGRLLGTLGYMSPEQIAAAMGEGQSGNDIDTRTDVYSLGVVLYELLTGQLPHKPSNESTLALVHAIRAGEAGNVARSRQLLGSDVSRIIETAIARDPAVRYQSVSELAADIRRYLENKPILAQAPGALYILRKFIVRNRGPVIAASSVALVSFILLGAAFARITQAERESRRQHDAARETVDFLINEVIEDLERISGTGNINRRVMERIVTRSAAMLHDKPEDPMLQANHARLLTTLGNLEIGDSENKREGDLFRQALALRESLASRYPDDPDHLMELGLAIVRLGDFKGAPACEPFYDKALEIDRTLVARYPGNRRYLDNLGHSYERIAGLYMNTDRLAEAEILVRQRLEIAATLLTHHPDHPKSHLSLCGANRQMSMALRRLGRADEAILHAKEAVRAGDELERLNPHHLWYGRWIILAREELSHVEEALGNQAAALEQTRIAHSYADRLSKENPADTDLRETARRLSAILNEAPPASTSR